MTSTDLKSSLELLYYVATIALAVIAAFGLRQIGVLKHDIRVRNERAAKEKAIEYSSRYLTQYVGLNGRWLDYQSQHKLASYDGLVGDFTFESIPNHNRAAAAARWDAPAWLDSLNELAAIAAAFTSGVADEGEGFNIIGRTFCATVASNYDIIAMAHNDSACPYYSTTVALYRLWCPRLKTAELNLERRKLEAEIAIQPNSRVKPIGCE